MEQALEQIHVKAKTHNLKTIFSISLALKEADETDYWLDLLHATNYLDDMRFESLANDCNEIVAILTSIIKTMRNQ